MKTTTVTEISPIDQASFEFVKDLAAALSRQTPIDIPSFPDIAVRVRSILEDENSSNDRIGRVVGSDPALASRILKMANSAALNRSGQQILDLKSAINRLGHDQIRASATSLAMQSLMDSNTVVQLKPFLTQLWKHSIHVAAIAYTLGRRTPGISADEALYVGLIHDIGKLYILTKFEDYPAICACPKTMDHIVDDWHTSIGKAILESWGFPENVLAAIEQHEDTERHIYGDTDLIDIIIVANLFANASGTNGSKIDFDNNSSCKRMEITAEVYQELNQESASEIQELMTALRG